MHRRERLHKAEQFIPELLWLSGGERNLTPNPFFRALEGGDRIGAEGGILNRAARCSWTLTFILSLTGRGDRTERGSHSHTFDC